MTVHDDAALESDALAYVTELYRELTQENGAAPLGTQNQAVEFILGDAELRDYVTRWAMAYKHDEAELAPPERLPRDPAYERIRAYVSAIIGTPMFEREERQER